MCCWIEHQNEAGIFLSSDKFSVSETLLIQNLFAKWHCKRPTVAERPDKNSVLKKITLDIFFYQKKKCCSVMKLCDL